MLAGRVEDKVLLDLMAHTHFRMVYDHRTPDDMIIQLQPLRQLITDLIK